MKKKFTLSTTQVMLISFIVVILFGSTLLSLPISSANGMPIPYIDALFTATTSTCVTGLVTLPTASTWSLFGQIVILLLIQIGGLGIITIVSGLMLLINKKLGIGDHLLLQDTFNLNTMSGLAKFVKNVLFGAMFIEGVGALLYMTVFIPEFGIKGVWISIFTSVSAFCNAGIDIISDNSLCNYATNPIINTISACLIILGGLGFIVWWDIIRVFKNRTAKNRKIFRHLTLHSKIVIVTTFCLITVGAILIFVFEYANPLTLGNMSLFDKIQVSFFQSITTRTAGFASVPQEYLTNAAALVSLLLMIVGGSPVGTAGGIKTVTMVVLVCSAIATAKGKNDAAVFNRRISKYSIRKAIAVAVTFVVICFTSMILLMAVSNADALDIMYESVSATATVGLSRNLTASLNVLGKIIIIGTMYLGRVGPMSLAIAIGRENESQNVISEPTEEISIG